MDILDRIIQMLVISLALYGGILSTKAKFMIQRHEPPENYNQYLWRGGLYVVTSIVMIIMIQVC